MRAVTVDAHAVPDGEIPLMDDGKTMKFESSWASDSVREDRKKNGDQLLSEEDLDRLPTDRELARLQRTTVLVS